MEDKNYRNLVKAIKNSTKIGYDFQSYLLNYVNGIKSGRLNNDFIDEDILVSVILSFANGEIKAENEGESLIDKFNEKINSVKFMLPEGEKTPEYESIKRSIMINKEVTSKELYSILGSRLDYEQIMSPTIIKIGGQRKLYIKSMTIFICNIKLYPISLVSEYEPLVFPRIPVLISGNNWISSCRPCFYPKRDAQVFPVIIPSHFS